MSVRMPYPLLSIRSLGALIAPALLAASLSGCLSGSGSSGSNSSGAGTSVGTASATRPSTGALTGSDPQFAAGPTVSSSGVITTVAVSDVDGRALANRVLTFGQVFVAGHAPQSVVLVAGGRTIPTQVDVKRRHPNGSIRHAIISAGLPATLSGAYTDLEIRQAGAAVQSGITVDAALVGGFDVVVEIVEGGTVYRASAADALRAQSSRWLDGAIATELRASVPLRAGTSAHPVFEAFFDVRFFSPTAAKVSVTIENTLANASRGARMVDLRIRDSRGQLRSG